MADAYANARVTAARHALRFKTVAELRGTPPNFTPAELYAAGANHGDLVAAAPLAEVVTAGLTLGELMRLDATKTVQELVSTFGGATVRTAGAEVVAYATRKRGTPAFVVDLKRVVELRIPPNVLATAGVTPQDTRLVPAGELVTLLGGGGDKSLEKNVNAASVLLDQPFSYAAWELLLANAFELDTLVRVPSGNVLSQLSVVVSDGDLAEAVLKTTTPPKDTNVYEAGFPLKRLLASITNIEVTDQATGAISTQPFNAWAPERCFKAGYRRDDFDSAGENVTGVAQDLITNAAVTLTQLREQGWRIADLRPPPVSATDPQLRAAGFEYWEVSGEGPPPKYMRLGPAMAPAWGLYS